MMSNFGVNPSVLSIGNPLVSHPHTATGMQIPQAGFAYQSQPLMFSHPSSYGYGYPSVSPASHSFAAPAPESGLKDQILEGVKQMLDAKFQKHDKILTELVEALKGQREAIQKLEERLDKQGSEITELSKKSNDREKVDEAARSQEQQSQTHTNRAHTSRAHTSRVTRQRSSVLISTSPNSPQEITQQQSIGEPEKDEPTSVESKTSTKRKGLDTALESNGSPVYDKWPMAQIRAEFTRRSLSHTGRKRKSDFISCLLDNDVEVAAARMAKRAKHDTTKEAPCSSNESGRNSISDQTISSGSNESVRGDQEPLRDTAREGREGVDNTVIDGMGNIDVNIDQEMGPTDDTNDTVEFPSTKVGQEVRDVAEALPGFEISDMNAHHGIENTNISTNYEMGRTNREAESTSIENSQKIKNPTDIDETMRRTTPHAISGAGLAVDEDSAKINTLPGLPGFHQPMPLSSSSYGDFSTMMSNAPLNPSIMSSFRRISNPTPNLNRCPQFIAGVGPIQARVNHQPLNYNQYRQLGNTQPGSQDIFAQMAAYPFGEQDLSNFGNFSGVNAFGESADDAFWADIGAAVDMTSGGNGQIMGIANDEVIMGVGINAMGDALDDVGSEDAFMGFDLSSLEGADFSMFDADEVGQDSVVKGGDSDHARDGQGGQGK